MDEKISKKKYYLSEKVKNFLCLKTKTKNNNKNTKGIYNCKIYTSESHFLKFAYFLLQLNKTVHCRALFYSNSNNLLISPRYHSLLFEPEARVVLTVYVAETPFFKVHTIQTVYPNAKVQPSKLD